MNEKQRIPVAFLGIGNGRAIIADALASHGPSAGLNLQTVDILPFIGSLQRIAALKAYKSISGAPGLFRPLRRIYEATGPILVDHQKVKQLFGNLDFAITVTPVAAQILQGGGFPLRHIVCDRRIQNGDVGNGIDLIGSPGSDLPDFHRTHSKRVINMIGTALPVEFLSVGSKERQREYEFDASPLVMFLVNGAGDMGRIRPVI